MLKSRRRQYEYRSDCHIHFARVKLNSKVVIMFVGYYLRSSLVTNFVGHHFRHFFIVISSFMTYEYFYPTMKRIAIVTSGESVFSARVPYAWVSMPIRHECQYRFDTSVSGDSLFPNDIKMLPSSGKRKLHEVLMWIKHFLNNSEYILLV